MPVNYTFVQSDGRVADFDDIFARREIFSDGTLWTWGDNTSGQLGDGTTTSRSSPGTTAGGGINWKQASGGNSFTAAIKTDGTLWTWGNNGSGRLGDGTTTSRSSPGTTAGGGTNWKQVSVGHASAAAIKTDGTLWTWGNNFLGQLGDGTTTSRSSPGTTAGGGTNWKQVSFGGTSASFGHVAAIKTDGTLWTWGINNVGQLGDGTTTSRSSPVITAGGGTNWKQVSVGNNHSAAIKTDGTLWTWGANDYGQLGTGNTTSRFSPGTTAGRGTNWKQVACGYGFTAAIKTDGTLWTWGYNGTGALGDGTVTSRRSPGTTAGGGTNWKQVSAGIVVTSLFSAAIKTDGTLWTWGNNDKGQLGDGTTTSRSSPGTIAGNNTNWKQVSCGTTFTIGLTDNTFY